MSVLKGKPVVNTQMDSPADFAIQQTFFKKNSEIIQQKMNACHALTHI